MSDQQQPAEVDTIEGSYRVAIFADDTWSFQDEPVRVYRVRKIMFRRTPGRVAMDITLREENT